jgi:hypothetical protein
MKLTMILLAAMLAPAVAAASPAPVQTPLVAAAKDHHAAKRAPVPLPVSRAAAMAAFAAAAPAPAVPAGKVTADQVAKDPLAPLKLFYVSDLQAALDDANSQTPPDTVGAGCYMALMTVAQGDVADPLPKGLGVFQAAQKVRDGKAFVANLQSPTGPLAQIVPACAQWTLDGANMVALISAKLGLTIATGGGGGIVAGGLGGILPGVLPGLLPIGGGLPFKLP